MEQMKDYLEVRSEKMNGEILREKIKNEESKSAQNMQENLSDLIRDEKDSPEKDEIKIYEKTPKRILILIGKIISVVGCFCSILGIVYSIAAFVILYFFGDKFALMFLDAGETEILQNARMMLVINSAFFIPLAFVNVIRFLIQGMGYSTFAILAGVFEMIARTLGGVFLVPVFGYTGACFASPLAWILADLFLFPSRYDNAPLVVREAAALHTPSLMLEGSTASAVIRNGENGFLTSENTEEYAGRIRSVLQDPELLRRVAQGASDSLARSWEDIAGEVADRYRNLINRYSK